MRATLEILDALLRRAKSAAAERGIPLRKLVCEALAAKFRTETCYNRPWIKCFGKLRRLHAETVRLNRILEAEFGQVEPEDWR